MAKYIGRGVLDSSFIIHWRYELHWPLLRDACPPLRPAWDARWRSCEKERFSDGTLFPPLLAISRRLSEFIDAKPRLDTPSPADIA
jgi:hypothetical protein